MEGTIRSSVSTTGSDCRGVLHQPPIRRCTAVEHQGAHATESVHIRMANLELYDVATGTDCTFMRGGQGNALCLSPVVREAPVAMRRNIKYTLVSFALNVGAVLRSQSWLTNALLSPLPTAFQRFIDDPRGPRYLLDNFLHLVRVPVPEHLQSSRGEEQRGTFRAKLYDSVQTRTSFVWNNVVVSKHVLFFLS